MAIGRQRFSSGVHAAGRPLSELDDGLKEETWMKIVVGIVLWLIVAFAGAMLFGCMARYGNGEPFDFRHGWKKPKD